MSSHQKLIGRRAAIAIAASGAMASIAALAATQPKLRVIKVVARKFEFVPGEIHVKLGQPIELRLTAPEVPMGFNLPDFKQRTDIMPGHVAKLSFTPDKAGSFTFLCDIFCGKGHEEMSGTLIVS